MVGAPAAPVARSLTKERMGCGMEIWGGNSPANWGKSVLGGSTDRKAIDVIRHKVKERPQ